MKLPFLIAALFLAASGAHGQGNAARVSGLWKFSEGPPPKLGIVLAEGDFHWHFLYADCDPDRKGATATLEVDPRDFGPLIVADKYMQLVIVHADGREDVFIESIVLNEAGRFGWSPRFGLTPDIVNLLSQPGQVHIELGERLGQGKLRDPRTYRLPERNRVSSAKAFLANCFGK